jgi:hypothetical protein
MKSAVTHMHQPTTDKLVAAAPLAVHVYTPESPLRHPGTLLRALLRDVRKRHCGPTLVKRFNGSDQEMDVASHLFAQRLMR